MKKFIIILIIATGIGVTLSAKVMRRQLTIFMGEVPETETLARETMEFVYDYNYCVDTTESLKDNLSSDQMLLQIGPDMLSKFSSLKNLTVDSLLLTLTNEQVGQSAKEGKLSTGEFMTIFKNHPQGKLTHTEKVCIDWIKYEEDMPEFNWELTDSVTTVLGYECKSAKCNFRGRDWTVFYAEDIPIMDGPWKFYGLPGLIMKASDEKEHYTFECVGIKSVADRPITMYTVPYNKTDRKGYYDIKHRYEINPYGYFEATTGGHITVTDEEGNPYLDSYDPIELPYKYIERDCDK